MSYSTPSLMMRDITKPSISRSKTQNEDWNFKLFASVNENLQAGVVFGGQTGQLRVKEGNYIFIAHPVQKSTPNRSVPQL